MGMLDCVFTYLRAALSNRLATTSDSWAEIFSSFNSGTYSNQWMVMDFNKLTMAQQQCTTQKQSIPVLPNDTMYIHETIPGYWASTDVSSYVSTNGYWLSYNVPYDPIVYTTAGYQYMKNNTDQYWADYLYDYKGYFRALLMSEFIHPNSSYPITSLQDFRQMLQYNEYQTDSISRGNPSFAIAARYDLIKPWPKHTNTSPSPSSSPPASPSPLSFPPDEWSAGPNGATDLKFTSATLFIKQIVMARSGE